MIIIDSGMKARNALCRDLSYGVPWSHKARIVVRYRGGHCSRHGTGENGYKVQETNRPASWTVFVNGVFEGYHRWKL